MDLDNKYELGEVVGNDAESKSFRAREIATGREVLVHILFGGKGPGGQEPLLNVLLQRMVDASPEKRRQVLEISDYKGMPFAVTEQLPGFRTLRLWVDQERAPDAAEPPTRRGLSKAGVWRVPGAAAPDKPAVPEAPPPPPPAPPDDFARLFGSTVTPAEPRPPAPGASPRNAGEFTQLFRATVGDPGQPPAPPPPVAEPMAPPPPRPAAPAVEPKSGPGEFTRLFQAPASGAPASLPQVPEQHWETPPEQPWTSPKSGGPGEFTRLFQAHPAGGTQAPAAPEAPPKAPATAGPGEFTRLFQSPGANPWPAGAPADQGFGAFEQTPEKPASKPADFTPPPPPPRAAPGEFTRFFGTPVEAGFPSQAVAPPVPQAAPPTGATGVFSTPGPSGGAPPVAAPAASPGPGEYTRLFGSAAGTFAPPEPAPAPPAAARSGAATPAPASGASRLPLFLILGFVLLMMVAVVLYFLLRK
jgi:hypothetical protein